MLINPLIDLNQVASNVDAAMAKLNPPTLTEQNKLTLLNAAPANSALDNLTNFMTTGWKEPDSNLQKRVSDFLNDKGAFAPLSPGGVGKQLNQQIADTLTGVTNPEVKNYIDRGGHGNNVDHASGHTIQTADGPTFTMLGTPTSRQQATDGISTGEQAAGRWLMNQSAALLGAVNPMAGAVYNVLSSIATGQGVISGAADTILHSIPGVSQVIGLTEMGAQALGKYSMADGLANSIYDAYKTYTDTGHVPSTLSGREVAYHNVESERAQNGHYNEDSAVQKQQTAAAYQHENVPAYARSGYGSQVAQQQAKQPAANPLAAHTSVAQQVARGQDRSAAERGNRLGAAAAQQAASHSNVHGNSRPQQQSHGKNDNSMGSSYSSDTRQRGGADRSSRDHETPGRSRGAGSAHGGYV